MASSSGSSNRTLLRGLHMHQGNHSLLRAMAEGLARARVKSFEHRYPGLKPSNARQLIGDHSELTDYEARTAEYRAIHRLDRRVSSERHLGEAVRGILYLAGLTVEERSYDLSDLQTIQTSFDGEVRFHVFEWTGQARNGRVIWKGPTRAPLNVFLIKDGSTFGTCPAPATVLGVEYYCPSCAMGFSSKQTHSCPFWCPRCLSTQGDCEMGADLSCQDCHNPAGRFGSLACFDRHRSSKKNSRPRCKIFRRCNDCSTVYVRDNLQGGEHKCGEEWCQQCLTRRPAGHECAWAEPSDLESRLRDQKKFKWAIYDIESQQSVEGDGGEQAWTDKHVAALIVLRLVCSACENLHHDAPCINCPDREKIFKYEEREEDPNLVMDRFLDYVTGSKWMKGRSVYAHNGGRYDSHIVLNGLLRRGFTPKIVAKGRTLVTCSIKLASGGRLTFKDSCLMIPMPLAAFASSFAIGDSPKGKFPFMCIQPKYRGVVERGLPRKELFRYDEMTTAAQAEFDAWYNLPEHREALYDYDAELIKYCRHDVVLLLHGMLKFREIILEKVGFCPFSNAVTTASFVLFLLRYKYKIGEHMANLPERGFLGKRTSALAQKWIQWEEKERGYRLKHSLNGGEKEFPVGGHTYSVDAWDEQKREIIEVLGCYFHGCLRCYAPDTRIRSSGQTAREMNEQTEERLEQLRSLGHTVTCVRECEIEAKKRSDGAFKLFWNGAKARQRLSPRSALMGGNVTVRRLYVEEEEGECIKYADIQSMYPYHQWTGRFPIGHPEIITDGFPSLDGATSFPYFGLARLRILPPASCKFPVLPYRTKDKRTVYPICGACAEMSEERCQHTDEERALEGDYCSVEIDLAMKHGYKIAELHEVWHWPNSSTELFAPMFKEFYKFKLTSSGFPGGLDEEGKAEFCRRWQEERGVEISPDEMVKNPALRAAFKILLNCGWGKLSENIDRMTSEFMTNDEIAVIASDENLDLRSVTGVTGRDDLFLIQYGEKKENLICAKYGSVAISCFVTSLSRAHLITLCDKVKEGLIYTDTDSLLYTCKKGEDPLAEHHTGLIGGLEDEVGPGARITKVVVTGAKSYAYVIRREGRGEEEQIKLKGVTLNASTNGIIKFKGMVDLVSSDVKEDPACLTVGATRIRKRKLADPGLVSQIETKKVRATARRKGVISWDGADLKTARVSPFGYFK